MNEKDKREIQIEQWLKSGIHTGDKFYISSPKYIGIQFHALGVNGSTMICSTNNDSNARISIPLDSNLIFKKAEDFEGVNPFVETTIQFTAFDLENILNMLGFDRRNTGTWESEDIEGHLIPRCSFNPYMVVDGEKYFYQRGNVWSLKQKQEFVNSIYRGLETGRIIVHKKSWELQRAAIKAGYVDCSQFDIVDGKQRLSCVAEFIQGGFEDSNGNVFADLSKKAKHSFMNYRGLLYGELPDTTSNKQICEAFLNNASAGIPISETHIKFVSDLLELTSKKAK